MSENLTLRYVLEFLIIVSAVIFAILPVLYDLRFKSWTARTAGIILLFGFVLLGAFIRANFMLSSVFILVPYAMLFFILYIMLVNASPGRKFFCFFNPLCCVHSATCIRSS